MAQRKVVARQAQVAPRPIAGATIRPEEKTEPKPLSQDAAKKIKIAVVILNNEYRAEHNLPPLEDDTKDRR